MLNGIGEHDRRFPRERWAWWMAVPTPILLSTRVPRPCLEMGLDVVGLEVCPEHELDAPGVVDLSHVSAEVHALDPVR